MIAMRYLHGFAALLFMFFYFVLPGPSLAIEIPQAPKPEYFKGRVLEVLEDRFVDQAGFNNIYQRVLVELEDGNRVSIEHGGDIRLSSDQKVLSGDQVVVIKNYNLNNDFSWQIIDKYRLGSIQLLVFLFAGLVVVMSKKKGLGAIAGLVISLCVIVFYIVPQINSGKDPLLISVSGGIAILFSTIFLAHGFSRQTSIALFSTSITLILTAIIAILCVYLTSLTGFGGEDDISLRYGLGTLNAKGLLLGGIIIGVLGILDDITTAQTTAIFEIFRANPKIRLAELFKSGMRIGNQHISSLVNTLILVYAGVSLPLFIYVVYNPTNQPLWVLLNNEFIAGEIVRSLIGSFSLVLAVPITTITAAYFAVKYTGFLKKG